MILLSEILEVVRRGGEVLVGRCETTNTLSIYVTRLGPGVGEKLDRRVDFRFSFRELRSERDAELLVARRIREARRALWSE
jgi:hypothetical protein